VNDERQLVAAYLQITDHVMPDRKGIEASFDVMRDGRRICLLIDGIRAEVSVIGERRMVVGSVESHELYRYMCSECLDLSEEYICLISIFALGI
jgi:hypothetical protein